MIDVFDSETIIKVYRLLKKKCDAIDKFINNHALYFGPCCAEYGAEDVCNNIIDLMTRKNKLINLKILVDNALNTLTVNDKKMLFIKMNYDLSIEEICGVLEIKERTAFRRLEHAYLNFAVALNNSKYVSKLNQILIEEDWITNIKNEVKERRLAYQYKKRQAKINNLQLL